MSPLSHRDRHPWYICKFLVMQSRKSNKSTNRQHADCSHWAKKNSTVPYPCCCNFAKWWLIFRNTCMSQLCYEHDVCLSVTVVDISKNMFKNSYILKKLLTYVWHHDMLHLHASTVSFTFRKRAILCVCAANVPWINRQFSTDVTYSIASYIMPVQTPYIL